MGEVQRPGICAEANADAQLPDQALQFSLKRHEVTPFGDLRRAT